MPEKRQMSVLVDTGFVISVYDDSRPKHVVAKKYYKYFLDNSVKMYLSTIVISEYQQKQSIVDLMNTGHFIPLAFNYDDALKAADFAYNLGDVNRNGDPQAKYKDDLKIMGQASAQKIDYVITEDEKTLANYCKRLSNARMFEPHIIVVGDKFDITHFNGGQVCLIDDEQLARSTVKR